MGEEGVKAIRAVVLTNHSREIAYLVWQAPNSYRPAPLGALSTIGAGGGMGSTVFNAIGALTAMQTTIQRPEPRLQPGRASFQWPPDTLEALLGNLGTSRNPSLFTHLQNQLHAERVGASGIIRRVKQSLAARCLIDVVPRGFGLLTARYQLPEATRAMLMPQVPGVQRALKLMQQDNPAAWELLGANISNALRGNATV